MVAIDVVWQVLNFFSPAFGVGLLASLLAKVFWRHALPANALSGLMLWTVGAGCVILIVGLLVSGHDGQMTTYAALVLGVAAILWWKGLRGR
jgi:hypothetical protein